MSGRRSRLGLGLAVPVLLLALATAPAARAATEVNYTFHVPAQVQTNPCFATDVMNLNGDIHIVMSSTPNRGGGYQVSHHLNSQLSGASITTGTKYVSSESEDESWFANPPFPVIHTHTWDVVLLSQSATDNYVMHMTMHETVNAMGMPTATVDKFWMECQG
jgi:phosphodiesterase/alkaline phosphatase D-like protein